MVYRRERPICRRALINLMKKYDCDTLEDLLALRGEGVFLSPGLNIQLKKMIDEGCFVTAKTLYKDKKINEVRYDKEL